MSDARDGRRAAVAVSHAELPGKDPLKRSGTPRWMKRCWRRMALTRRRIAGYSFWSDLTRPRWRSRKKKVTAPGVPAGCPDPRSWSRRLHQAMNELKGTLTWSGCIPFIRFIQI